MLGLRVIKKLIQEASGITLVETTVSLGILALALGMVGTQIFQVLAVQERWQDDSVATKDLRHAESWFAGDALNAKTTDLIDGAGQVNSVTLSTFDGNDITYSVSGTDLVRSVFDGVDTTDTIVASGVTTVMFSRSGRTVDLTLVVSAEQGSTDSLNLMTHLR